MVQVRLSDLSTPRQVFIRQCQRMGFGKIVGLAVRGGDPIFTEATQILIDVKLEADEGPRAEQQLGDFVLCAELVRLFRKLDTVRDGEINLVEVRTGIPRRIVLKAPNPMYR